MAHKIPQELRGKVKLAITETALLGPLGAFHTAADVANISVSWGYLLHQYAKHYQVKLDKEGAVKVCTSALMGMGGYYTGCKLATELFRLIPKAGKLMGMGVSSLQNMIFTYRFAEALTAIFSTGQVDSATLASSIEQMFGKIAWGLTTVVDIVDLYLDRSVESAAPENGSDTQDDAFADLTGTQKHDNVEIIRDGTVTRGSVSLERIDGKPCVKIDGTVVFQEEIIHVGERHENGRKYLEIRTRDSHYLIAQPEGTHNPEQEEIPDVQEVDPVVWDDGTLEIIRNGFQTRGPVSMEEMNGKPCLKINGVVLFQEDILFLGDQQEKAKTYLEILTRHNCFRIWMPKAMREQWKNAFAAEGGREMVVSGGQAETRVDGEVEILRNGTATWGYVSLEQVDGRTCVKIGEEVLEREKILCCGEQTENGKTYLEILTVDSGYLISMPEPQRRQWQKVLSGEAPKALPKPTAPPPVKTQIYSGVEIIRNGSRVWGQVALKHMGGHPYLSIVNDVLDQDILAFRETEKNGKTYLEIETRENHYLLGMSESQRKRLLEAMQYYF